MLFLVERNGVPSQASSSASRTTGDTTPPTAPANLVCDCVARAGHVHLERVDATPVGIAQLQRLPLDRRRLHADAGEPDRAADRHKLHRHRPRRQARTTTASPPRTTRATSSAVVERGSARRAERPVAGPCRRLRLRRGQRHDRRRPVGQRQQRDARQRNLGKRPGKFGNALSFNGTNAWVTVARLELARPRRTGLTLEGWVNPATLGGAYRTVVFREQPGNLVYALYANRAPTGPAGRSRRRSHSDAAGTARSPLGSWTHLAATYDGTAERLYVNGTLRSRPLAVRLDHQLERRRCGSAATRSGASTSAA